MCLNKVIRLGSFRRFFRRRLTHKAQGSNRVMFTFLSKGLGQLRRALLVLDFCLFFGKFEFLTKKFFIVCKLSYWIRCLDSGICLVNRCIEKSVEFKTFVTNN